MAGLTYDLDSVFRSVDDLDKAQAALVRERVIRDTMTKTGEDRRHVADMLDAMESMGQEAVLDLTEGEPTTLRAAVQRYVDDLEKAVAIVPGNPEARAMAEVVEGLSAILAYPFPGPSVELEIKRRDESLEVWVGGELVAQSDHDEHGQDGMDAMENASRAVHREVMTRLGSA